MEPPPPSAARRGEEPVAVDELQAMSQNTDQDIILNTSNQHLCSFQEIEMGLQEKDCSVVKISEPLLIRNMSNSAIWNTNNSNLKKYLQARLDIQKVVESVYSNILQRYATPEAMQASLGSSSGTTFDRIASTIIIEMTHHLQSLLSGEVLPRSASSSTAENIVEEVVSDITIHCKSCPSDGQNKEVLFSGIHSAAFLEEVISGLLYKIICTSNVMDPKDDMLSKCETATTLVYLLLGEINKSQIKVVGHNLERCSHLSNPNNVIRVVDSVYHCILKEFGSYQAVQKAVTCITDRFVERVSCLLLAELDDYQIQQPFLRELAPHLFINLQANIIIQKIKKDIKKPKKQDRPFSPLTTMLSARVVEDIVVRLISKIFPSSANGKCTGNQSSLPEYEFKDMNSKLIHEVMREITNHEIWYTHDATYIQCVHEQKDAPDVVDSVYNNILDKYGTQLTVQDNKTTGSKKMVKTISRLLIREISNPNFMAVQSVESSFSYSSTSASCVVEQILCGLDGSWESSQAADQTGAYSTSFLEEVISGILSKIFITILDQIMQGKDIATSEAELQEVVRTFVNSVLLEIKKAQVRVTNILEEKHSCPEIHRSVVNTIVNSVFNNICQDYENDVAFYACLTHRSSFFAEQIICLVSAAISDDQLQRPVTEAASLCSCVVLDAKNIVRTVVNNVMDANKQVTCSLSNASMLKVPSTTSFKAASVVETVFGDLAQPYDESYLSQQPVTVLSSSVLEEIVAKFLSKLFFNCPNLALCTKDISSVYQVKEITEKLLNALLINISGEQIHVFQDTSETRFMHPKDNQVVERVVDSVYSNVFQIFGSHFLIYQHLSRKGDSLSQTVASLMIAEISNYCFQPCYTHGKLSDSYVAIELSYIVQRVLNEIRGMPSHSPLLESSSHVLYATFLEEIVSQFLTKMFVSSNYVQTTKTSSNSLEAELSKTASRLINTVLKEMSKNEINVIKLKNEEPCLQPEDEDFISEVVDSVFMNALHESGSPFNLFKAITSGCTIVSERIASLVIKEISKYQLQIFPAAGVACDLYTDVEVAKIVEKVLTHVIAQSTLSANAENIVHSVTDKITDTLEDLPNIIPHIKNEPLKIDTAILVEHLSVLSIKTESLDLLKKQCLLQTGQTLEHVRRITFYEKSASEDSIDGAPLYPDLIVESTMQRRASLDKTGRIAVKPKKLVSRNSFLNILKPDITNVELLKDVKTKHELIVHLVAHGIEHIDKDEDIEDVVLNTQPCKTVSLISKVSSVVKTKNCCMCCSKDSTKTMDSQRPYDFNNPNRACTIKDYNKNASATKFESSSKNANCNIAGLQFNNFEKRKKTLPARLNINANSTSCRVHDWLDTDSGRFSQDSFLGSYSSKKHVESSNSTFPNSGRLHIPRSDMEETADSTLPMDCDVTSATYQPAQKLSVATRMSTAFARIFSSKASSKKQV